jgi:hypothetical protein
MLYWLLIFYIPLKFFSLISCIYGDVNIASERQRNLGVYSTLTAFDQKPIQQSERSQLFGSICLLLNYSEHCRLEASAREQSQVLALLNWSQGGIFIMPHLLWQEVSVFPVSSEGPFHSVASYDTYGNVEDLF